MTAPSAHQVHKEYIVALKISWINVSVFYSPRTCTNISFGISPVPKQRVLSGNNPQKPFLKWERSPCLLVHHLLTVESIQFVLIGPPFPQQWPPKNPTYPSHCLMASINSRKLPTFFKLNILEMRVRKNSLYFWLQQYPTFSDSPVWLYDSAAVQIFWLGKTALVVQESKYLSTWCRNVLPQDQHPKPQDGRRWERIKFDVVLKERKKPKRNKKPHKPGKLCP